MAAINTNDMGKDQKELLAYLAELYPAYNWKIIGSVLGVHGWIIEGWVPGPLNPRVRAWRYDPTTETKPDLLAKLKASLDGTN